MTDGDKTDMDFRPDEAFAQAMDARDPLRSWRDRFHIPKRPNGEDLIYFAGNSLGLQPKGVRAVVDQELDDWASLAVEAHFHGARPWLSYHEQFRESGARLVGARPGEVVMMNALTVNLHLMMVSFYRPTRDRFKIVMEDAAFGSDTYAVKTQLGHHGIDPADGLIVVRPREGRTHAPNRGHRGRSGPRGTSDRARAAGRRELLHGSGF